MMIRPESFIAEYKHKSYAELLPVRDEIIENIHRFENKKYDSLEKIARPSPEDVYQYELVYLEKICELIYEKYNQEFVHGKYEGDGHYLFLIKSYLDAKGLRYDSSFESVFHERKSGRKFSIEDHIRGLVYALLTNQTKWKHIELHLTEIDKLFFNYDPIKIKETSAEYFCNRLFDLKCGNISTKAQMQSLNDNITTFEKIEKDYDGGLDAFVISAPAHEIVQKLSKAGSPYKLHMLGEALVCEYIRNMGIDGAKPDTHLRRFFGVDRMGMGNNSPASINEVTKQVASLANETGLMKMEIDNLIWSYCADGYGEVCTSTPHCSECVIRQYCKKG